MFQNIDLGLNISGKFLAIWLGLVMLLARSCMVFVCLFTPVHLACFFLFNERVER